uniref:Toll-like receptor 13 n=1 Tax=Salarias fasciatus TaxID=181472 RepID=A0A672GSP7_SALFA
FRRYFCCFLVNSALLLLSLLLCSFLLDFSLAFSLKNCTVVYLDANANDVDVDCSSRHLAVIPDDIPRNARILELSENGIMRISKVDLRGLSKLETLQLHSNVISLMDDGAFIDLTELVNLTIANNELTKLTDKMFQGLSGLIHLNLNINQIFFISARAFEPLISIRIIQLAANQLQKIANIIPALTLKTLVSLDLSYNGLLSFQSDNEPLNASNLMSLDLSLNPLTKFSLKKDIFPHLQDLSFEECLENMEWDVANKTFLRNLTRLSIRGTNFSLSTYKAMFRTTGRLQELDLSLMQTWIEDGLVDTACQRLSLRTLVITTTEIESVDDVLLKSCSGLSEVNFTSNAFVRMSKHAFRSTKILRILSLKNNKLSKLSLALQALPMLEYLDLSENIISELDCLDFRDLTRLKSLNLMSNRISVLQGCVFEKLKDLEDLNIGENEVIAFAGAFTLPYFGKLKLLNLHNNHLDELQQGAFSSLSSLRDLDLGTDKDFAVELGAFNGLDDLESLTVSLFQYYRELFSGLPSVKNLRVFFIFSTPPGTFQPYNISLFSNLVNLTTLTVKGVELYHDFIKADVLSGLKSLERLMTENFFTNPLHPDTFKYTPRLRSLQIIYSNLLQLSPEVFWPLTNLEELDLSNNNLRSLDFLAEAKLSALKFLKLSENEVSIINETLFQSLPALTYLDLSENLLTCECSNSGFVRWATSNNQTQVANGYRYICAFPVSQRGERLLDFDVRSCWMDVSFLCFVSIAALILLVLLSSFIHHFLRFHLIYAYYLFLAFLYDNKRRKGDVGCQYDAFISYNVCDEAWVYEVLVPELEGQQGWKLCLHHRDFEPGMPIIQNITDAIYSSRKTICVISRHYLQSEWCSREIQMASYRLFDEHRDVLILLFVEDVPAHRLTAYHRMRSVVKRRSYLSWPRAAGHPAVFWQNVRRALGTDRDPRDQSDLLGGP